jgi:hypothetical protein
VLERLDESGCLQLIGGGRLGRLAYTGRVWPHCVAGPVQAAPRAGLFHALQDTFTERTCGPASCTLSTRSPSEVHRYDAETLEGWVVLVAGPGASCRHRGRACLDDQRRGRPWPELQPPEALGEDVRGDPGNLAEQVIEPLRPAVQRLDHERRPPVTDPCQRPASWDEPFSCSAMSGSKPRALTSGP